MSAPEVLNAEISGAADWQKRAASPASQAVAWSATISRMAACCAASWAIAEKEIEVITDASAASCLLIDDSIFSLSIALADLEKRALRAPGTIGAKLPRVPLSYKARYFS